MVKNPLLILVCSNLLLGVSVVVAQTSTQLFRVRYGYFTEARPIHAACARGWLDVSIGDRKYEVACYPQTSGNFAASRLDSKQLDIANLGSTPLAQAIARGIDLQVVYITQYMGESQGIYARVSEGDYVGVQTPFDLRNRTIGVPFGSTMHYQVLFLLDIFNLKGKVTLLNLAPSEIIRAWDEKRIDVGACWGAARDYLLRTDGQGNQNMLPANTLLSAGVLANWGRSTFTVVAADRQFAQEHAEFMDHFIAILSRINDSFLDRLGQNDGQNPGRWSTQNRTSSLIPSMADAMMSDSQEARKPSSDYMNSQRRALDLFIQQTAEEQLSCDYLGRCDQPSLQHIATYRTAEFLLQQKIISNLGLMEGFDEKSPCISSDFCNGRVFEGDFLDRAQRTCDNCYPVGPYPENFASNDALMSELERLDRVSLRSIFAPNEVGRFGGSICPEYQLVEVEPDSITGVIGDGAKTRNGLSYSANLECSWEIRTFDCPDSGSSCLTSINLQLRNMRIWSGDFLRIYTDESHDCSGPGTLLAQISGTETADTFPPIYAQGCMFLSFTTDANQEQSYGDASNSGDGFVSDVSILSTSDLSCNGFPVSENSLCMCDGFHWGGDCTFTRHCLGTNRLFLDSISPQFMASSERLRPENLKTATPYPNDLDCTFEIQVLGNEEYVEISIFYDLEDGHDYIMLENGSGELYHVLTGNHSVNTGSDDEPERYWVPVDSRSRKVRLHMVTDSRGRRGGFYAVARVDKLASGPSVCPPGYSGSNCEIPYCQPSSQLSKIAFPKVDASYVLGRGYSQQPGRSVRPMPWGNSSGCEWHLRPTFNEDVVALRLVFGEDGFDLEPYPESAVGDKLVVRTSSGEHEFFVEECENDEVCSYPWQTGICSPRGGCTVKRIVEVPYIGAAEDATIVLITDRNDGGNFYNGVEFDTLLVEQCPSEAGRDHCEAAKGGECVNGACICEGGVPCTCPCEGEPPSFIGNLNIGLVVGIVIPLFLVMFAGFFWYRHRKILKSRAQKEIIQAKEEELEAFRNSVVGMRTAVAEFLPFVDTNDRVEQASISKTAIAVPDRQKIQWCWQETPHMMHLHDPEEVIGDPADCFILYSKECSGILESAFQQQGKTGHCAPMPGYSVDFDSMIQTKLATGFKRKVQRLVQVADAKALQARIESLDMSKAIIGDSIPDDLRGEPQVVLVTGDVIQISSQRQDGWAFGTKLHHSDEVIARELVKIVTGDDAEDANIFTDTGWFQLEATEVPSAEDLAVLQNSVGNTEALDPPSYWDSIADPTVVQLKVLSKSDTEFLEVVDAFKSTLIPPSFPKKTKVMEVQRIQNLAMWQSYVVKRQTICYRETGLGGGQKSAADEVIQRKAVERFERKWLWHGTNAEVMDKIMQQGFNRSFCGKNATMYGKGVYFARDASYSAYPTYAVPDKNGYQYMMACRVVVGEYCLGTRDALTPDIRDAATQSLYDTTVGLLRDDTMANPSIYVTYHDAQAYPEIRRKKFEFPIHEFTPE